MAERECQLKGVVERLPNVEVDSTASSGFSVLNDTRDEHTSGADMSPEFEFGMDEGVADLSTTADDGHVATEEQQPPSDSPPHPSLNSRRDAANQQGAPIGLFINGPPVFNATDLPPPAVHKDEPPPPFEAVQETVMEQVEASQPPPVMTPSAPAFDLLDSSSNQATNSNPLDGIEQMVQPPSDDSAVDDVWAGLSPDERKALMEEQRKIMEADIESQQEQRLVHRSLSKVPLQVRFGAVGALGNVIFLFMYNFAVAKLEHIYEAATVYCVVYFIYIPLGHALTSSLVFGWPKQYLKSLLSNYPIGLTAMALGTVCTAYLDKIGFNEMVEDFVRKHVTFMHFDEIATDEDEKGEFYSSILVLIITSVWTYVLSVMVNTPSAPKSDEKKEL